MKIVSFIVVTVILILLNASCKKSEWFDAKSDINQTVPATLQDFEYLLDNFATMTAYTSSLAEVGSDGHYMTEARWAARVDPIERNVYTWTNTLPNQTVIDWNSSYKRIFQCNLVLDGLKKLDPTLDAERYNRIKGNALFHRAKNYYDLAQIYAQPYQVNNAESDLGIPLKDGIDVTEPAKRSSVKTTYEQIITDLRNAADLLPDLPELKARGSKTAAFALLARTYLAMNDFGNAGMYAESSLSLYNSLIDFNTISLTATDLGAFNLETVFYAVMTTDWTSIVVPSSYSIDIDLYNLYDINDLRKTRFFIVTPNAIAFKGNYSTGIVCFNGLAVDEQYLIRAECFARAGNVTAAMKDLNELLKTRWDNKVIYPIRTASDAEDALRQVLLERRKELLFRNLRWTDLRRLNQDPRFKITLTRTIGGSTYTLEPGSYKYTLPIPDDVMNLGPQMKQSPGW